MGAAIGRTDRCCAAEMLCDCMATAHEPCFCTLLSLQLETSQTLTQGICGGVCSADGDAGREELSEHRLWYEHDGGGGSRCS